MNAVRADTLNELPQQVKFNAAVPENVIVQWVVQEAGFGKLVRCALLEASLGGKIREQQIKALGGI